MAKYASSMYMLALRPPGFKSYLLPKQQLFEEHKDWRQADAVLSAGFFFSVAGRNAGENTEMNDAVEVIWKVSMDGFILFLNMTLCRSWISCSCNKSSWMRKQLFGATSEVLFNTFSVTVKEHWVCSPCVSEPPPRGSVLPNPSGLFSAYMVHRMSEMHWILILCSSLCVRSGLDRGVKHIPETVRGLPS